MGLDQAVRRHPVGPVPGGARRRAGRWPDTPSPAWTGQRGIHAAPRRRSRVAAARGRRERSCSTGCTGCGGGEPERALVNTQTGNDAAISLYVALGFRARDVRPGRPPPGHRMRPRRTIRRLAALLMVTSQVLLVQGTLTPALTGPPGPAPAAAPGPRRDRLARVAVGLGGARRRLRAPPPDRAAAPPAERPRARRHRSTRRWPAARSSASPSTTSRTRRASRP